MYIYKRGGAGNIGSPGVRPVSKQTHDTDIIPELAIRPSQDGDYHTGVCFILHYKIDGMKKKT